VSGLRGIWAAVVTPIDTELQPDAGAATAYYGELLHRGCDGLNVLGTTGEAQAFGAAARADFMERIASRLPRERLMVGTGATALADAVLLTRTAAACGFAAALILPPPTFGDAGDDGAIAYFDALFTRAQPPPNGVLLYNFPARSGVTFGPSLVARLLKAYPGIIAGIKDSSNDAVLQQRLVAAHPGFAVFPSSEEFLGTSGSDGTAGCISGTVALWPELAKRARHGGDAGAAAQVARLRRAVAGPKLIARVRYLVAKSRGDERWSHPVPPLSALSSAERASLDAAFEAAGSNVS
jgi:4-hydroxy-tetrahydrodipicolinate synthase